MTPADKLLPRLEGVRATGPGRWVCRCPAHDDRGPSLSLRDTGERFLIHCFAGCVAADVVAAVGLSLADLFDDAGRAHRPGDKRPPRVPAADLLLLASREVMTASIIAADFLDGRAIDETGWQRLAACAARLGRLSDEVTR